MSGLVNYDMGSSDESEDSETEETEITPAASSSKTKMTPNVASKPTPADQRPGSVHADDVGTNVPPMPRKSTLFASLPRPKGGASGLGLVVPSPTVTDHTTAGQGQAPEEPPKKKTSLFSSLPPPKQSSSASGPASSKVSDSAAEVSVSQGLLKLPPPKRKQPVKISLPAIPDPDSDEDEPEDKRPKTTKGAGLFSVLPKPRTAIRKEANRLLIPHTLTKRPTPAAPPKPAMVPAKPPQVQPQPGATLKGQQNNPSKGSALVSGYPSDDEEDEDGAGSGSGGVNFFSMGETSSARETNRTRIADPSLQGEVTNALSNNYSTIAGSVSGESSNNAIRTGGGGLVDPTGVGAPPTVQEPVLPAMQDQPLVFNPAMSHGYPAPSQTHHQHASYAGDYGAYQEMGVQGEQASGSAEYYHQQPYQGDPWGGGNTQASSAGQETFLQDEGFARMVGKKNRGKEEIQIIDITADDQIGPTAGLQQMVKSMTEEKEYRGKLKKEQLPTSQQKRKHQITYLARQAKERELELKNQWADNRQTRKQTQAKYGF